MIITTSLLIYLAGGHLERDRMKYRKKERNKKNQKISNICFSCKSRAHLSVRPSLPFLANLCSLQHLNYFSFFYLSCQLSHTISLSLAPSNLSGFYTIFLNWEVQRRDLGRGSASGLTRSVSVWLFSPSHSLTLAFLFSLTISRYKFKLYFWRHFILLK